LRQASACSLALLVVLCTGALAARAEEPAKSKSAPFELLDGDRVAFVGNAFLEREQKYSYLETLLATHWPDRNVTFRNLAWSGDTVFGHARAAFETPAQGFERLVKVVHEQRPTVLFISYGMAESFEGEKGLVPFRQGLEKLLDHFSDLSARTVLISPIRHENLGAPLPNPDAHNRDLEKYVEVMRSVAAARGHRFINLFSGLPWLAQSRPLTENGIHLSPYGYWRVALVIEKGLGLAPRPWEQKGDGVEITGAAGAEAAEKYRRLAIAKNVQFFNQWRPENETYLFGFRRNEQGQNAKEMPMFDKPIAEIEAEMAKVRSSLKASSPSPSGRGQG
jgi:lysophospholipase L1-like esterase